MLLGDTDFDSSVILLVISFKSNLMLLSEVFSLSNFSEEFLSTVLSLVVNFSNILLS
jgi:hypothetical protein